MYFTMFNNNNIKVTPQIKKLVHAEIRPKTSRDLNSLVTNMNLCVLCTLLFIPPNTKTAVFQNVSTYGVGTSSFLFAIRSDSCDRASTPRLLEEL